MKETGYNESIFFFFYFYFISKPSTSFFKFPLSLLKTKTLRNNLNIKHTKMSQLPKTTRKCFYTFETTKPLTKFPKYQFKFTFSKTNLKNGALVIGMRVTSKAPES
jgi:hypothetical protein